MSSARWGHHRAVKPPDDPARPDPDTERTLQPPRTAPTASTGPSQSAETASTADEGGDGRGYVDGAPDYGTDRYEDLGRIARGGQGEVRRVRDHKMDRVLALKLLRPLASESARRRFLAETAITVRLQHPGIVPVYDRGVTGDGRPWYTMKEVEGREFNRYLAGARDGHPDAWTPRQLLDAFSRICEAVAYAHEQGVVHRDLKPGNVMVGRFGEVLVMDWGLARRAHGAPHDTESALDAHPYGGDASATAIGAVLGTPAYMAPEQAAGDLDAIAPTTDVYALGVMLYELLTGERPLRGTFAEIREALLTRDGPTPSAGPPPLRTLCARALARDPADRPADAGVLAREVAAWLAGARQREQARALVEQARSIMPRVDALIAEANTLDRAAAAVLDALPPHAPIDDKRPGWRDLDAARARRREARLAEVRLRQLLQSALELDPGSTDARAALGDHYRARLLDAEAARDADRAAEYLALLEGHDADGNAEWLRGAGWLTLVTDPPGARVEVSRYVERDHRLVEDRVGLLGVTPLRRASIAMGSYMAVLRAPGRAVVRYPFQITRRGEWHGTPPGAEHPHPIALPPADALSAGERYVPAGWFEWGDADTLDGLPRSRLWVDAFVIGRDPVTHAEYIEWLDALAAAGRSDEAVSFIPPNTAEQPLYRLVDGRFELGEDPGHAVARDHPATSVTLASARAFCAWRAARDGLPWRLPMSWEWEKAARGIDGRAYPWGDAFESTFACVLHHRPGRADFSPVGSHPIDESPYGVRDLAGNARGLCGDAYRATGPVVADGRPSASPVGEGDFSTVKGGCAISGALDAKLAGRYGMPATAHASMVGFRLCRSLT